MLESSEKNYAILIFRKGNPDFCERPFFCYFKSRFKNLKRLYYKKNKEWLHIIFLVFFLGELFLTVTRDNIKLQQLSYYSNLAVWSVLLWSFVAKKRQIVKNPRRFLILTIFVLTIVIFITLLLQ